MESSTRGPPAIKKGWVRKQGRKGMIKNWKTRFAVLIAGKLSYYVKENETFPYGEDLKGDLSLANCDLSKDEVSNEQQIFIASFNGENSLLMEANTEDEAREWKLAIRNHISFANRQSASNAGSHTRRASQPALSPMQYAELSSNKPKVQENEDSDDDEIDHQPPQSFAQPESKPIIKGSIKPDLISVKEQPELTFDLAFAYITDFIERLVADSSQRQEILDKITPTIQTVVQSSFDHLQQGNDSFGSRNEILSIVALVFLGFVIIGVIPIIAKLFGLIFTLVGILSIVLGFGLVSASLHELQSNFSLLIPPNKQNTLITSGIYQYIRHPFYSGLWFVSLGFALLSTQTYKMVLVLGLLMLFYQIALLEEEALNQKHSKVYSKYAKNKPMFFPFAF